jgi:hypothetical protein
MKLELPRQILQKVQMKHFMKIRPVAAELFPANRQTDRHDEASSRF